MTQRAASYKEVYPTGRKHCPQCGHWRHLIDFPVREWADVERTVARLLAANCNPCHARRCRRKHGWKPRNWYQHGVPGSPKHRQHELERNRATHAERIKDPAYYQQQLENLRIYYHGHKLEPGRERPHRAPPIKEKPIELDPTPFLAWVDRVQPTLDKSEQAVMRGLRRRRQTVVEMSFVDEIMTRNGCMLEMALIYPPEGEQLSAVA